MKGIHATAIVEDGVELGADVELGPYTYVRAGAKIGAGTRLHSHVNVWGESVIGEENEIFPYTTIGAPTQILGDKSTSALTLIGNKNIIREGVQIHRGSSRGDGTTRVGNENFIMTSVHIAHDCQVGNKVIIATKTGLAGHVTIQDFAIVSGACGVLQHARVGSYAFCGGMFRCIRDLPPYMCGKEYGEVTGPNLVGLKRAGFKEEEIRVVKEIYKTLYVADGLFKTQLQALQERFAGQPVYERFREFVKGSKVGILGKGY